MISDRLANLVEASSAPASRKALSCDLAVFRRWSGDDDCFPADDITVAEFIASMSESRAVSTIIRYVSSLSRIHERAGWENPARSEIVRSALSGLRKTDASPVRRAPALTGKQLISICRSLSRTSWAGQRNRALFAVGWSCGLRCSELGALNLQDIEFVDGENGVPSVIVHIRRSKTDRDGVGQAIGIPSSPIYAIIHRWTEMLISLYLSESGPLFPRFSCSNVEKYFPPKGMRPRLSVRGISKTIRTVLDQNDISGSVHSLRRGIITEAARLGVPEHIIQRHARHASVKSLRGYIEAGTIFSDNPLPIVFDDIFGSIQEM